MDQEAFFIENLIGWYHEHRRSLPWRETKNPYFIWLSEIILQQTRVEQGLPYYLHFIEKYPTVDALAMATEDEVMKSWEGLGYYSRARNLHATARVISSRGGVFPNQYEGLLQLKGIGDYTASAIASFAFNRPVPVVDGNVLRLVSRYFGKQDDIHRSTTKREFKKLLEKYIVDVNPADFNNGIMEFGALQCVAKKPNCSACPLQKHCWAYQHDQVEFLPYSSKKIRKKKEYLHYFLQERDSQWIRKRGSDGIWGGLYELPGIATSDVEFTPEKDEVPGISFGAVVKTKSITHHLTHRTLLLNFWSVEELTPQNENEYLSVPNKNIHKYPFPKAMHWIYSYF